MNAERVLSYIRQYPNGYLTQADNVFPVKGSILHYDEEYKGWKLKLSTNPDDWVTCGCFFPEGEYEFDREIFELHPPNKDRFERVFASILESPLPLEEKWDLLIAFIQKNRGKLSNIEVRK